MTPLIIENGQPAMCRVVQPDEKSIPDQETRSREMPVPVRF